MIIFAISFGDASGIEINELNMEIFHHLNINIFSKNIVHATFPAINADLYVYESYYTVITFHHQ